MLIRMYMCFFIFAISIGCSSSDIRELKNACELKGDWPTKNVIYFFGEGAFTVSEVKSTSLSAQLKRLIIEDEKLQEDLLRDHEVVFVDKPCRRSALIADEFTLALERMTPPYGNKENRIFEKRD